MKLNCNSQASLTKRPKEAERRKSQADLITAALDMEEDNIKSHRDYLVTEEERRRKARVIKPMTVGPKLRWRSRVEDVSVTVYDPVPVYQSQRPSWTSPFAQAASSPLQNPYSVPPPSHPSSTNTTQAQHPPQAAQYPFAYGTANTQDVPTGSTPSASKETTQASPPTTQSYSNQYYQYSYYTPQAQSTHSQYQPYGPYYSYQPQPRPHLQLHPQAQIARKATEKQTKNYVELLVNEERPQIKPTWREMMNAVFGEHTDWDTVRVYVGKNRPIGE